MKTLFLFAALVLFQTSLSYSGEVNNGGNVLEEDAIPAADISDFLSKARGITYMYFLAETFNNDPESIALMNAKPSIFELLENIKIDIKVDSSCSDELGNPSDASSISNDANAICISVERLHSKLAKNPYESEGHYNDFRYQIIALIVHEYSHRVGYDELKAVALQKYILAKLRKSGNNIAGELNWGAEISDAKRLKDEIQNYIWNEKNLKADCEEMRIIYNLYNRILNWRTEYAIKSNFFTLSKSEYQTGLPYLTVLDAVWNGLEYYLNTQDIMVSKIYSLAFRNSNRISGWDYLSARIQVFHDMFNDSLDMSRYLPVKSVYDGLTLNKLSQKTYTTEVSSELNLLIPYIDFLISRDQFFRALKDSF